MTSDDDVKKATKDSVAQTSQAGLETKDKVEDAVGAAPDTADDLYKQARTKTKDMVNDIPGSASDAFAAGHEAIRSGGERVARRVTKQPVEAILLAGAIGYLIGWAGKRD